MYEFAPQVAFKAWRGVIIDIVKKGFAWSMFALNMRLGYCRAGGAIRRWVNLENHGLTALSPMSDAVRPIMPYGMGARAVDEHWQ